MACSEGFGMHDERRGAGGGDGGQLGGELDVGVDGNDVTPDEDTSGDATRTGAAGSNTILLLSAVRVWCTVPSSNMMSQTSKTLSQRGL